MRRISILAIVVLLLVVVELVAGMFGTWNDNNGTKYIKATMADIEKPAEGRYYSSEVILRVYPLNPETAQIGEAYNLESQCATPFIASRIVVGCWLPFWVKVMEPILSIIILPFLIWGVICFFKILLSVRKQHIFTRQNAKRLRVFVYGVYGSLVLMQSFEWLQYQIVSKQVVLENLGISSFDWVVSWSDLFVMALIAEIFALGVKLQEEQEFTI